MKATEQKQARKLVINADHIKTIEVSETDLAPVSERALSRNESFNIAPPNDFPWDFGA